MEDHMILETERLILRRFREEDLQDLTEYLSDADTVRFEPYPPMSEAEVRRELTARIASEEMIAVELKASGKMIGNLYLGRREFEAFELGYVFNRKYWRQGYAKEACEAMIRRTFSDGAHRVYAECDPCNEASRRLLERLGFRREAHYLQNVYFWMDEQGNPIWKDTLVYARLSPSPEHSRMKEAGEDRCANLD